MVIAETRILHRMEHTIQDYYVVHSEAKYAGLMIMVRKRIAGVNRITWRIMHEGRLAQVKVHGMHAQIATS